MKDMSEAPVEFLPSKTEERQLRAIVTAEEGFTCSPHGVVTKTFPKDTIIGGKVAGWAIRQGKAAIETKPIAAIETKPVKAETKKKGRRK
jgi:hypothetical protein